MDRHDLVAARDIVTHITLGALFWAVSSQSAGGLRGLSGPPNADGPSRGARVDSVPSLQDLGLAARDQSTCGLARPLHQSSPVVWIYAAGGFARTEGLPFTRAEQSHDLVFERSVYIVDRAASTSCAAVTNRVPIA